MLFKDATITDLPLIVEIYNSTVESRLVTADTEPVSVESREKWFHDHNPATRPLWMISDEKDNVIGWASFQNFYGRPAYKGTAELSIYLAQESRGHGYGKKILDHCLQKAPELGLHTVLGIIFAHNLPSLRLFENAGFSEWGSLPEVAVMDGNFYSVKILGRKIAPVHK